MAEVPEGPPARFTWRRVLHRVVRAEGPERLAPEWWRALADTPREAAGEAGEPGRHIRRRPRPRDYYRVEDETGARFWVFREGLYQAAGEEGAPGWFLHGLFG